MGAVLTKHNKSTWTDKQLYENAKYMSIKRCKYSQKMYKIMRKTMHNMKPNPVYVNTIGIYPYIDDGTGTYAGCISDEYFEYTYQWHRVTTIILLDDYYLFCIYDIYAKIRYDALNDDLRKIIYNLLMHGKTTSYLYTIYNHNDKWYICSTDTDKTL